MLYSIYINDDNYTQTYVKTSMYVYVLACLYVCLYMRVCLVCFDRTVYIQILTKRFHMKLKIFYRLCVEMSLYKVHPMR